MLNSAWLSFALLLTLLGVATRQAGLFVVGVALLLAEGASWLWGRRALVGVAYQRRLSQSRAFFGEEIALEVVVDNRKLLPLAWLAVEDELPEATPFLTGRVSPSHKPRRVLLKNLLTLRWYERIVRRYRLVCANRGEHLFGPASLRTGDVFGFVEQRVELAESEILLVYPRVLPLRGVPLASRQVSGMLRSPRRIIDDPLRVAGIREYAPGDSMRRVHWKASAHAGHLQSKILEPSTNTEIILALNVSTYDPAWLGIVHSRLELAIITTVALARAQLDAGKSVGLIANSDAGSAGRVLHIPSGRDPQQFARMLDACARVSGFERMPFPACLEREARALPWTATLVVVSSVLSDGLAATLLKLRRAGRTIALVLIGDDHPRPLLPGIQTLLVQGEREWRKLEAVALV